MEYHDGNTRVATLAGLHKVGDLVSGCRVLAVISIDSIQSWEAFPATPSVTAPGVYTLVVITTEGGNDGD